jgi:hypothetical protein
VSPTFQQLVCGYSLHVQKERITSISSRFCSGNEPAMVSLHRLGADERSWFTPEEARRLAAALMAAADVADGRETP